MTQQLAPLRVYDLLHQATYARAYSCLERDSFFDRVASALQRHEVRHIAIIGQSGSGKSTLLKGFAAARMAQRYPGMRPVPMIAFDTNHLLQRLNKTATPETLITHLEHALASLPACFLVLDDAEHLLEALSDAPAINRVLLALTKQKNVQIIATFDEKRWAATLELLGTHAKKFERMTIPELTENACQAIIHDRARYIAGQHRVQLMPDVPRAIVEYSGRLPGLAQPARALHLLDEVCAAVALRQEPVVTRESVHHIFSQRTGQTATAHQPAARLRHLRTSLPKRVVGQPHILSHVTSIIERGWLGLKNPQRPLGSFLFLGPSGVGKTELARVVAEEVYGTPAAFVRLDMSEFGQAHSVQRLIGAPPGYVGYEAGGQLTSAVLKQPFSLLLLDEIEKADPTVFDIFLQILEDGRLTDGQGTTVDFRQTIIMATSNIGVEKIIAGWLRNEAVTRSDWLQQHLMPDLTKRFRLEFLNRFEALGVFTPFSEETLLTIATIELAKIAERVQHHNVTITIPPEILAAKVRELSDPRFGARPLKRWLESTVETALAEQLLAV